MTRSIFTTMGSPGDVYPFLEMARVATLAGETALVIGPRYAAAVARAAGVPYDPLRGEPDAFDHSAFWASWRSVLSGPTAVRIVTHGLVDQLATLPRADRYVSHLATPGLGIYADLIRAPWVMCGLAPMRMQTRYSRTERIATWPLVVPAARLRRQLGLPTRGHALCGGQWSPYENWALFDRTFADVGPGWPPHVVFKGFQRFQRSSDPAELERLHAFLVRGLAPVVFAPSATNARRRHFWDVGVEAARVAGRRAVLMGADAPLAKDCLTLRSCATGDVFRSASAVVHTGGIGVMADALHAQIPQVIYPVVHDQHDNAQRAAALGVAVLLSRWSVASVAAAIQGVMRPRRSLATRLIQVRP